jgi:UDP-N-acetylmuramoyl-tripeptide--D-alanyl-D-alanine ligase
MNLTLRQLADWCKGTIHPPEAGSIVVTGVSTDSRTIKQGDLFVAIVGLNMDGHRFIRHAAGSGAVAVVVEKTSPSLPELPYIKVDNTIEALGRMAHGYRWHPPLIPWIGVTGSNGKTTTREILSLILHKRGKVRTSLRNWNNFIGLPLSMMSEPDNPIAAVMEIGTNHPGEVAQLREILVPTVGIVTCTGSSHLAGFGSPRSVAMEKADIFGWLPTDGMAIFPASDPNVDILRAGVLHNFQTFSIDGTEADLEARNIRINAQGTTFEAGGVTVKLPLLGRHNIGNCLAAMLAARFLGISLEESAGAVSAVKPVAGRLQCITSPAGLRVINDSYNANPESVLAALEVLMDMPEGRKIAVLGAMLELGAESRVLHREVGFNAGLMGLDALYATGSESVVMAEAAQVNAHINVRHFPSADALWMSLKNYVKPGDWILVKGSRGMMMERIVNELMDWNKRN